MGLKMVLVEEGGATAKLQIVTRVTLDVQMKTVRSATNTVCSIVIAEQLDATVPLFALTLDLKDVKCFKCSVNSFKYKRVDQSKNPRNKQTQQILKSLKNQNQNLGFVLLGKCHVGQLTVCDFIYLPIGGKKRMK